MTERQEYLAALFADWNAKSSLERTIINLMQDITLVKITLGTITDKLALSFGNHACLPDFYPSDLTLFRWIVENGVMKSPEFRNPMGYKVLDFLTMLSLQQEAVRAKVDRKQRTELNQIYRKHFPKTA